MFSLHASGTEREKQAYIPHIKSEKGTPDSPKCGEHCGELVP